MVQTLRQTKFGEVDLSDPFFDSLKRQYQEFSDWFERKRNESAYVIDDDDGSLRGFVYLKVEDEALDDVTPKLPQKKRLKVGTLKVEAKGTKLGERIIKRIFDHSFVEDVDEVYVTAFREHERLIRLFESYGFVEKAVKTTQNGDELVLVRELHHDFGDINKNYPRFRVDRPQKWLLAIKPEYHTQLLPNSILRTENKNDEEDVPHTNSVHKVYIAGMPLTRMRPGDLVVFYRTTDIQGRARFRSVATSLCVVEDTKKRSDFANEEAFVEYANPHSVFTEEELRARYSGGGRLFAAKMTYNTAFAKRPTRGQLLDDVGISENPRWDLRRLSDDQFARILELGEVNESLIIDKA